MLVAIANQQTTLPIDEERLDATVRRIMADAGYDRGEISVAVVDDPTIHALNRRHLRHDYATDVLSFPLVDEPPRLEGEIVVSAETAASQAGDYGWPAEDELLLYVVHGALHLVGFGDKTEAAAAAMRQAEARHLRLAGVTLPASSAAEGPAA